MNKLGLLRLKILSLVTVLLIFPLTNSSLSQDNALEEKSQNLSDAIADPLYSYDLTSVESILKPFITNDQLIQAIELVDSNTDSVIIQGYKEGDTFHTQKTIPSELKDLLKSIIQPVIYDQEQVGTLHLYYISRPASVELTLEEQKWIAENPSIKVGNELDWPPFDFAEDGEPKGYSIDFIRLIGEKTGLNIEFVNGYSWAELLAMFKAGELDVLPVMAINEERQAYTLFTQSYVDYPTVLVTRNDDTDIVSIADISSDKIAVVNDYNYEQTLRDLYPEVEVVEVTGFLEGLTAVLDGNARAFVGSRAVVNYTIQDNLLFGLRIAGPSGLDTGDDSELAIGVRKDLPLLHSIVSKGQAAISSEEERSIAERWMFSSPIDDDPVVGIKKEEDALLSKTSIQFLLIGGFIAVLFLLQIWRRLERQKAIYLTLVGALLGLIIVGSYGLLQYLQINKQVSLAEKNRNQSLRLADMLRQTSDDLTRMARTYVFSGERRYLEYFERILAIRNGSAPRPHNYHDIYWDYVVATGSDPRPDGEAISFEKLMEQQSFSQREFNLLRQAKRLSNRLALIEKRAIAVAQGLYPDPNGAFVIEGAADKEKALNLLFDQDYHLTKASIMELVEKFTSEVDQRTADQIYRLQQQGADQAQIVRITIFGSILLSFLLLALALFWFKTSSTTDLSQEQSRIFRIYQDRTLIFRSILASWPLLLAATVVILLIVSLTMRNMKQLQDHQIKGMRETLQTVLVTTTSAAYSWVEERKNEVSSWAHLQNIRNFTDSLVHPDKNKDDYQIRRVPVLHAIRRELQPLLEKGSYTGFLIMRNDGFIVASDTDEYIGQSLTDEADFKFITKALSGPRFKAMGLPVKRGSGDRLFGGTPLMMVGASIPLYSTSSQAVLVLLMDPEQEFTTILQRARMGESGESYAFNRHGEMISESRFDEDLYSIGLIRPGDRSLLNISIRNPGGNMTTGFKPSVPYNELPFTKMAQNAINGRNGSDLKGYNDYRGVPVIGAWHWNETLGFGITSEMDVAEAYSSIREIRRQSTINLFTSIGLILALTILFIRNRIKTAIAHDELVRSEDKIAAQLAFQTALLDALPNPIFVKSPNTAFTAFNTAYEEAFGVSRHSMLGKTVLELDFIPEKQRKEFQAADEKLISDGGSTREEITLVFADGKPREMLYWRQTFNLNDGTLGGLIGVLIDITDRKEAELAVIAAEERSRLILESVGEGIFGVGSDGLVNFINPAALDMVGFEEDEIKGNKIHSIIHHSYSDGSNYPVSECPMYQSFTEGVKHFITDEVLWRKDGSSFPVEYTSVPIEKDGELLGSVVVFRDISERKKAETALKENEEMLSKITSSALSAIIMISSDTGEITFWNETAERIFGWSISEVIGKELDDLIVPEQYRGQHKEGLEHFRETGEGPLIGTSREITALNKQGIEFPIELLLSSVKLKGVWHAIGLVSDITVRKEAEAEIRKAKEIAEAATKAKSDFLANMSHEIRTPMNAVIGLSDLCLKTDLSPKQHDYLEKIHGSAHSLLGIINDILDFSKIEAGKLDIEEIPFELDKTLNNLATLVSVKTQEKGIELLFSRDADLPINLIGDPLRLGQVLTNLTNNAVKFTDEGEIIVSISLKELGTDRCTITFRVKDSGIGMTEEQRSRLFQSFSQADTSTTRKYGGTGLGLAISKQLVELMGGEIWVESESGVGSTFAFTAQFGIAELTQKEPLMPTPDLRGMRVLVVDDNENARLILGDYLRQFSFEVEEAKSGDDALDLLLSSGASFDLIMLDYMMPGLNGIQTAQKIRESESEVKIILVSALNQDEYMDEPGFELLDSYLSKPTNPSLLFDVIMEVFGKKEAVARKVSTHQDNIDYPALNSLQGASILLVEDNKINQQVATELLEQAGFTVDIANHGEESLEMIKATNYDCVLMDVQMPIMDGYTATGQIREIERFADLPILAMTANALAEDRERAIEAGMNDHITKPISPEVLFSTLIKWIDPQSTEKRTETPKSAPVQSLQDDELPTELPGIDIQRGIALVGGNEILFAKLLREFLIDHEDDIAKMKHAADHEDYEKGQRLAHTLKGLGGTIGAVRLSRVSEELETAFKEKSADALDSSLPEFNFAMTEILTGLEQSFSGESIQDKTESDFETADIFKSVEQLEKMLEEMDPEAEELAIRLKQKTGKSPNLKRVASKLVKQVGGFEFEEAQGTLDSLKNKLKDI